MHKLYSLLILVFIFINSAFAQQPICGFDAMHKNNIQSNIEYRKSVEQLNVQIQDYIDNKLEKINTIFNGTETIYEIPVVIHVIHTGGAIGSSYNPADTQLINWINFVNKVFAAEATDFGYPSEANGGVKIPIRLKLAQKDINCVPTTGITRHDLSSDASYVTNGISSTAFGTPKGIQESVIHNLAQWDISKYYNIYVINKFNGADGNGSAAYLAGYAYLPSLYNLLSNVDGSVMLAKVAKAGNSTLPHEIGHAWGLYHTFEGQSEYGNTCITETNCNTEGDLVCDTEPSQSLLSVNPYPTSTTINPCTGVTYKGVQNNIMNYGQNLNKFTLGQKERMMAVIGTIRKNLAVSVTNISNASIPFNTSNMPAVTYPTIDTASISDLLFGFTNITLNNLRYAGRPYQPGINNIYENYTNACQAEYYTTLDSGSQYSLNYQVINAFNNSRVKLQIDWNNNGIFEASEIINSSNIISTYAVDSTLHPFDNNITINIPNTVPMNTPLRMRLSHSFNPYNNTSTVGYSPQVLDFAIMVVSPVATLMEIEAFSVKNESCNNEITYQVNRTENNELATLEYSEDGKSFSKLVDITHFNEKVSFTHANLSAEKYYYRIKLDGENKKYSHIISQQNKCFEQSINVYPNPTNNKVIIYSEHRAIKNVSIYNMNGAALQQLNAINQHHVDISLSNLHAGIYIIEIITQDGQIIRKIISKI